MVEESIYGELLASGRTAGDDSVLVQRPEPDRAVVTLNEPERLNPLSAAICVRLNRVLEILGRIRS